MLYKGKAFYQTGFLPDRRFTRTQCNNSDKISLNKWKRKLEKETFEKEIGWERKRLEQKKFTEKP